MRTYPFLALLCCVAGGCASGKNAVQPTNTGERSAVVIHGSDVNAGVIDAIRLRIPGTRISTGSSRCPHIIFRAEKSIRNQGDPTVYVDGTRMADTCSLLDVAAGDIDHIAVYPSGMTQIASIERNPFGLILIYRRR